MSTQYSHNGDDYRLALKNIHQFLKPKTYLEIGTREGGTLALAECPSIAVDPLFVLDEPATGKRSATFYLQTTSDDFFAKYDPTQLLNGKIDFCFLDGLHEWETLLRDFFNAEKYCNRNSIIAIHDCLPTDTAMASRADNGGWWTGDVWKVIPVLKQFRPDLKIISIDAPPTGLVLVTNLDPDSNILERQYFDIAQEWRSIELDQYGIHRLFEISNMMPTSTIQSREEISKYFWI